MRRDISTAITIILSGILLIACGGGGGSSSTSATSGDNGDVAFEQSFGGTGDESGIAALQTSDGGYILLGNTNSSGNRKTDIYLVKTDSAGQKQWEKTFGGTEDDYGSAIAIAPDNGFIIVGKTESMGSGFSDIYLIKTDSAGNEVWSKTFGGAGYDYASSVQTTSDGGYVLVGTVDEGFLSWEDLINLIKVDEDGNTVWSKTYGDLTWSGDKGVSVLEAGDGGYVVYGEGKGAGLTDYLLFKTDVDGVMVWENKYGGSDWEYATSFNMTTDGGFILLGQSNRESTLYLVKTDSTGAELWSKTYMYGENDINRGYAVQQTSDGGFVLFGETIKFDYNQTSGPNNMYLVKTDDQGNKSWEKTFDGDSEAIGKSIIESDDGEYVLFGTTISSSGDSNMYLLKI
ncbi:MAG: hypothetical protein KKB30_03885 [Proteobacteria bacterium]|nr:hypothetical protein [Pseudomonadota bacterium]MBU1715658.1 hypothetical protein [Pseudomonadota bacterium]